MRNLKKVLSLALCLVMLLGMMVVGAGAADFKDASTIQYKEAAAVLDEIDVINGYEDDSFRPTEKLTRAQGAAIVYRLIMGGIAKDPEPVSTGFVDVDGNADVAWASGYIAACAQQGILSGVGGNKFEPTGELSGYAFAKMLLVALGYDAGSQGYTGTGWEANVLRDAYVRGITVNNVSVAGDITREQAAQMALQTLEATMVEQTPGVSVNGVVIPGSKATDRTAPAGAGYDNVNDSKLQFCELYFPGLRVGAGTDAMGNVTRVYTYNNKDVVETPATAFATFTSDCSGATDNTVANALATVKADSTIPAASKVQVNGADHSTAGWTNGADNRAKIVNGIKGLTGDGTIVKVYIDDNRNVTNVSAITPVAAKVSAKVTVSGAESVTVGAAVVTAKNANKAFFDELYALDKGDYVLLALNGGTILDVLPATLVEGKFTAYSGASVAAASSFTIDGTKHAKADGYNAANEPGAVNSDVIAVLDEYGYVKGFAESASVTVNFGYSLDGDMFGNFQTGVSYQARLVLSDGTVEAVEVAKVNGEKPNSSTINLLDNGKPVSYSVDADGKYSITVLAKTIAIGTDSNTADGKITKGDTKLVQAPSTTKALANNKTLFLVIGGTTAAPTYTTYVGVSNVPSMINVKGDAYMTGASGSMSATDFADLVVIKSSSITNTVNSYIYYLSTTKKGSDGNGDIYSAIVDGAVTDVTMSGCSPTEGLFTNPGYNDSDVITSKGEARHSDYKETLSGATLKLDKGVLTLKTKTFVVAEDFVAFEIDYKGSAKVTALTSTAVGASSDVVSVATNADGLATAAYWKKADTRADAASLTGGATKAFEAGDAADSTTFDIDLTNGTVGTIAYSVDGIVTAAVDASGNVTLTPVAAGTSTVTITVNPKDSSTHKAVDLEIAVTVKAYAGTIGAISGAIHTAGTGTKQDAKIVVTLADKTATKANVVASGNNTSKCTVSVGEIVTAGDGTKTVTITVAAVATTTDTDTIKVKVTAADTDNYTDTAEATINVTIENEPS